MNPKSQPLPRSAFAAFCAFALAASMALPFMGASKSYAEEVEASADTMSFHATCIDGQEPVYYYPGDGRTLTDFIESFGAAGGGNTFEVGKTTLIVQEGSEQLKKVENATPETFAWDIEKWARIYKVEVKDTDGNGVNDYLYLQVFIEDNADCNRGTTVPYIDVQQQAGGAGTDSWVKVPTTVVGGADARNARVMFTEPAVDGSGNSNYLDDYFGYGLCLEKGNLVLEGEGEITGRPSSESFEPQTIRIIPAKGKLLTSVKLVPEVNEFGIVTHLTVKPVYVDGDLGVVVTDKNAQMDIPVIYDRGHSDNPVFSFTASGILNGANVPEGSRVYVKCNPSGASANSLGWIFRLVVDGQYVTGDFGTVTLTAPACIPGQADGKTHQVTVKTSEGAEDTFPMALVEGAKVTVTMTKCDYDADGATKEKLFYVNIVLGNIIEGGSQGNSSQGGSSQSINVEGDTGIAASGTLSGVNIPKGADVTVGAKKVTSGDAYEALTSKLGNKLFGDVFEVTLFANGNKVHDGFGKLTLSFPVGEENNGYNFTVYHRHQDGRISAESAVAKNGAVTVTVTDLSSFALVKGEKASTSGNTDTESNASALAQTGDTTPVLAFGGFALAALGAVAFAGYRARKSALK